MALTTYRVIFAASAAFWSFARGLITREADTRFLGSLSHFRK